ncbi:hypothetical protein F2Q70_00030141 [Brassica cretica]|uniref:Uncharacterized protein n=1 Tax=Brassica cretica TaxID=69181 RepID=A0A8S9FP18_BRACR|nr:hypothetical protein F2Q70_00030141 [Brassica cretica]KAF3486021.1 hypothetical protein F2Q69_00053411 [Brassica cretica]
MMYEMEQVGKIHLTGVDIDRWENVTSIVVWLFMSSDVDVSSLVNIQPILNVVNAESSVSSLCIDSIVLCISCSLAGVESVSIDAIMCSSVDLGDLPSSNCARFLSIDADIWC